MEKNLKKRSHEEMSGDKHKHSKESATKRQKNGDEDDGDLIFWQFDHSEGCRAVKTLLNMGMLDFEKKDVNLMVGEHMQPEYQKVNPKGLVPAIKDGSFILTESATIMKYLVGSRDSLS